MPEEEFEYADYDLEEDVTPVPASEALPYPDVANQDEPVEEESQPRSFVNTFGRSPAEAIAVARSWVLNRRWCGVGQCLATVRQYYNVPSKYGTASLSWEHAEHKNFTQDGDEAPRGAPVWWTGGSSGAGHVAISVGGGLCITTDWKSQGRVDYARINDITSQWGLNYRGWTREVNDVVVWRPKTYIGTVHLSNLRPGKKNDDVLKLKKRLREKGYGGFMLRTKKFGKGTKLAYAKYQRRLGYTGDAADGVPGRISLRKLGFKVL